MIKTLVSIEVDLASSLAIRFACQLGGSIDMEIHPIYVKESLSPDSSRGAGWASRTWEREMVEKGKEEISKMIAPEMDFCPKLYDPSVIYGDRHSEVSRVAQEGGFDLYVEGTVYVGPWGTLQVGSHQVLSAVNMSFDSCPVSQKNEAGSAVMYGHSRDWHLNKDI